MAESSRRSRRQNELFAFLPCQVAELLWMIVVAQSELPEFIHFLRMKCNVTQLLHFSPPNEGGEVLRAVSGEHLIFGLIAEDGDIHVSSDDYFEPQIAQLWRRFRP